MDQNSAPPPKISAAAMLSTIIAGKKEFTRNVVPYNAIMPTMSGIATCMRRSLKWSELRLSSSTAIEPQTKGMDVYQPMLETSLTPSVLTIVGIQKVNVYTAAAQAK